MNTNDKNYVDRLHYQQVNGLNEIKNRLMILEGKQSANPDGTVRVEIDTDKVYEMFLKACHDCLQQRQERHQEEDRQAAEKLRRECEAKGERYYPNEHEWRVAVAKDYDEFFSKMLGLAKITDRRYRDIKTALLKLLDGPQTDTNVSQSQHLFSNLPSGFPPKLTVLRHRLSNRIRTYLSDSFTLPREWTILTVILYFAFLILLTICKISIDIN